MSTTLVALYSHRPGSGKSTTAAALRQRGWAVEPFAAPLKAMVSVLLEAAGYCPAEIERLLATGKQEELGYLAGAPTARRLLQTLGTAWGRETIHPRLWIELWEDRVHRHQAIGRAVVCDDLRTQEELAAVRALGGQVWLIDRPAGAIDDAATVAHATEGQLAAATFDRVLRNEGTIADLQAQALMLVGAASLGRRW